MPSGTNISKYTYAQLQNLWKSVGGNPTAAPMAAAVALAESSGNPNATNGNGNGTIDRGLWQINSIHGSLSTFDPIANAKAAVQISGNGSNWRPWCTAWSDGHCGGSYLGTGAPYQKYLTGSTNTGSTPPSVTSGDPAQTAVSLPDPFGIRAAIGDFLKTTGMWFWYGLLVLLGLAMMAFAVWILVRDTRFGQLVSRGSNRLEEAE